MNNTQQSTVVAPSSVNQPSLISSIFPILLIVVIFYFLIMRPQQKKEEQRQKMIGQLRKGDKIVASSGIIGTVHKILNEKEITLEIAEEIRIRMLKSAVSTILDKNTDIENQNEEKEIKSLNQKSISTKNTSNKKVVRKKNDKPADKIKE